MFFVNVNKYLKTESHGMKIKNFLPYVFLFIILLSQLVVYSQHTSELDAIPACVFGCYRTLVHSHFLNLIFEPDNMYGSSSFSYDDNFPNIFPKAHAYVQLGVYSVIGPLFDWSPFDAWKTTLVYSAFLFVVISLLIFYASKKLTGSSYVAILFVLILNKISHFPVLNNRSILPQVSFLFF